MQIDRQQYANNSQAVNLLSIERAQKLDLLMHLITNLQQPLILQGALGAGKTTLLSAVEFRKTSVTDMFLLNLVQQASFESIQAQIVEFIKGTRQLECYSLADALDVYAQQEFQLVLLIDDADQLVAGLMSALIDYASKYTALRLVFALTSEEYKEKSQLEKIQTHCHFIELPALSVRQCEAFIRSLVEQEVNAYTLKDINVSFIGEIYRETKGNPGKISAIIKSAKKKSLANSPMLVIMVVTVFICSALVSILLWQEPEQDKSTVALKPIESAVELIQASPTMAVQQEIKDEVLPELEEIDVPLEKQLFEPPLTEIQAAPVIDEEGATLTDSIDPNTTLNPMPDKADKLIIDDSLLNQESKVGEIKIEMEKKEKDSVLVLNTQDDRLWVLAQNRRKYTLQLMVSRVKDKLLEEQEKYLRLGIKTFYLKKKNKQLESYVLFYGIFSSIDEAKTQMEKLPKALQESWPRTFSAIQKDL